MKTLLRYQGDFRWEGVEVCAYKAEGTHFRDVTRQALVGAADGLDGELRYFEIEPDGHTTLERHEHAHAVMILRGEGRVLIGTDVVDVHPFDLVKVPPGNWHQFHAGANAALGFLCLVNANRDRPVRPSDAELETLCADPEVAGFIRP